MSIKRLLFFLSIFLVLPVFAEAYSGAGSIWAQPKGYFIPVNFNGDSTGFGRARDLCISKGGGVIQLGPGCESIITTYPANAGLTVIKAYITGWAIDPFAAGGSSIGYGLVTAIKKGSFNIKAFDGTTSGLQQAFDYSDSGTVVNVYSGYYPITTQLTLSKPGVKVIANGDSAIFANYLTADTPILKITGNGSTVEGMYFDGRRSQNLRGSGITVASNNTRIDKCKFYEMYHTGVYFDTLASGAGYDGCRVQDSKFSDIGNTTDHLSYGIRGNRVTKLDVSRNRFLNIYGAGVIFNKESHDVMFSGNQLDSIGFDVSGVQYERTGFYVDTLAYRIQVVNNTFRNVNTNAVQLWADSSLVVGNSFYGGTAHIHVHGSGSGSRISQNLSVSPFNYNIYLELYRATNNLVISGNNLVGAGVRSIHSEFNAASSSDIYITNNDIMYPGRRATISAIGILSVNGGKVDRLNISYNTINGSTKHGIEFSFTGANGYFRSTKLLGNQISYSNQFPIFTNSSPTFPCSLFVSDNYYYGNVSGDAASLNATNWVYQSNGIINSQHAFVGVSDSLRVNKVANFDAGIQVKGNSWIAGRMNPDSLRVTNAAVFDNTIQAKGNSWVAGRLNVDSLNITNAAVFNNGIKVTGPASSSWIVGGLNVSDSTRTKLALVSDSLRARKVLVQDSLRVNNGIDLSSGNVTFKFGNGVRLRDHLNVDKSVLFTNANDDAIIQAVGGAGSRVTLQSNTGAAGVSTDNTGDTYIGSSLNVTDSLRVSGNANWSGSGKYHNIGANGTTPAETTTVSLKSTDDITGGLSTRSPKIEWIRNGVTRGQLVAYAGGLEVLTDATSGGLAFGSLGGTTATAARITAGGNGTFSVLSATDSVTTTSGNITPGNYLRLKTGLGIVGEGTASLNLSNTGTIKFKTLAGADVTVIGTAGGTNNLRIFPLVAGGQTEFLNTGATASTLTLRDDGIAVFRPFTFATLPTVVAGGQIFCSDCKSINDAAAQGSAAASGGTGTMLWGFGGSWRIP